MNNEEEITYVIDDTINTVKYGFINIILGFVIILIMTTVYLGGITEPDYTGVTIGTASATVEFCVGAFSLLTYTGKRKKLEKLIFELQMRIPKWGDENE